MSGLKVPDVPKWERSPSEQAEAPAATDTDTVDGRDFVPRTLKTTIWVMGAAAIVLAGLRHYDWILPVWLGAGLGALLLWGFEKVVRKAFTAEVALADKRVQPEPDTQDQKKKFGGKAAILVFALIKYPLVALLLWVVARYFSQEQVIAFITGFILFQIIIGLRGLGGFLFPQTKAK